MIIRTAVFLAQETLMSMPHLMLTMCLRADSLMLRSWRQRCDGWRQELTEPPHTWLVGLRAFQKAT